MTENETLIEQQEEQPEKKKSTLKGILIFAGAFILIIALKEGIKNQKENESNSSSSSSNVEGYYSSPCFRCGNLIEKKHNYYKISDMPPYDPAHGYIFCSKACSNAFINVLNKTFY